MNEFLYRVVILTKYLINEPSFIGFIIGIGITIAVFALHRFRQTLPIAYNVAVVGFPKSGKTTLITSVFSQLFSDRFLSNKVILRTKATIERVNRDLERLELGKALGPTTDQDLFAYRADIKRGSLLFRRVYKVEIGDFPGEDSKDFSEKEVEWLHETSYFKWVMEADAFIFIIDLAHVLSDEKQKAYRANITKAIRAAWQNLFEYHIEGRKDLRRKTVLLVFTKADLLVAKEKMVSQGNSIENYIEKEIMKLGFGDKLPDIIKVKKQEINELMKPIISDYDEIIGYLNSQTASFHYLTVSHFAKDEEGRHGIPELVRKILPR